jgi:hypothetical protein
MALNAAVQIGPAARSFADDAHNCIMVRSAKQIDTEYKAVARLPRLGWRAPLGSRRTDLQAARRLMSVKGEPLQ